MKNKNIILILITFALFLSLTILFPPSTKVGIGGGDTMYKAIQIRDLIYSNYSSISCHYRGKKYDPDFKYFPYSTWLHVFPERDKCYYSFPWQLTFTYLPFFLLFDMYAFYLVSMLSGALLLPYLFLITEHFNSNKSIFLNLTYASFAWLLSAAFVYSFTPNEHCLSALLLTATYYHLLKQRIGHLFMAGILLSLSVFIRIETGMFLGIIPFAYFLMNFSNLTLIKRRMLLFTVFASIPILAGLIINYFLFDNIFGLRGSIYASRDDIFFLQSRWDWFGEYFFTDTNSLFRISPVFLAIAFFFKSRHRESNFKAGFLIPIFFILLMSLIHPPNADEPQYGRRFLYATYPLLAFFSVSFVSDLFKAKKFHFPILITFTLLSMPSQIKWTNKIIDVSKQYYPTEQEILFHTKDVDFVIIRYESLVAAFAAQLYEKNIFLIKKDSDLEIFVNNHESKISRMAIVQIGKDFLDILPGVESRSMIPASIKNKWSKVEDVSRFFYHVSIFEKK